MNHLEPKLLSKINQNVKLISSNLGYDNVLIHSDLKNLFLFPFKSKVDYLNNHLKNINNIFSEFNIWMPTFNYDFTNTGIYDVINDESQIGVLNNYFMNFCDWRTTTPVFNFAGNGKYPINEIHTGSSINPFSFGSEFDYLYKTNSLHCHYGSNISDSTLFHYVEKISKKLLYRYDKKFHGSIKNGKVNIDITLDYHVSPLNPRVEYNWNKIHLDLLNENLIHEYKIFEKINYITLFSIKKVSDYWVSKLNNDPFYFLNEESKKWVIPKVNQLGRKFELNDFENFE